MRCVPHGLQAERHCPGLRPGPHPGQACETENAPVEEPSVEEAAPARERSGKRKRSFGKAAGAAAPRSAAAPVPTAAPAPVPSAPAAPAAPGPKAPVRPAFTASSPAVIRRRGKRKRIYAKAINPEK